MANSQALLSLLSATVTTAVTADVTAGVVRMPNARVESLTLQAVFTYGSGGTNATAYVQTTFDGGTTWMDIACFQFTTATAKHLFHLTAAAVTSIATPGDAALTANTCVNGFLGDQFRVKLTTTGTYAGGTTFAITAMPK